MMFSNKKKSSKPFPAVNFLKTSRHTTAGLKISLLSLGQISLVPVPVNKVVIAITCPTELQVEARPTFFSDNIVNAQPSTAMS